MVWTGQPLGRFRGGGNRRVPAALGGFADGGAVLSGVAGAVNITSLSAGHASIGASLTITGSGFGASRGTSAVYFGEPLNEQGWRPVTLEAASYVSWSDTSITVTVPSMSPGKAGEPGTYHRVRVEVGGVESNAADFYIDPVTTLTAGSSTAAAYAVCAQTQNVDGTNYTTTWNSSTPSFTSNSTMGVWFNTGVSDVLFDGVTFTATNGAIWGSAAGVVTIGHRNHQRLTFLNCTFTNNTGVGGGYSGAGVNGVKVAGYGGYANNDLTFVGCSFGTPNSPAGAFNRIGYEQVEESIGYASLRTQIIDCDFEPCSGESISFNAGNLMALVSGCTLRGIGLPLPNNSWLGSGQFESNSGRYIELRDTEFWNGYGPWFNFNNQPAGGRTILVKRCHCDQTHFYQTPVQGNAYSGLAFTDNIDVFDTYFNMGTAATHHRYAGGSDWSAVDGCDFSGSTITGYYEGGATPANASSYWVSTGSGNTLPTIGAYSAHPHT